MLLDHLGAHVGPVADGHLRHVTRQVVGDTAPADRVRADRRRAFRDVVGTSCFAVVGLSSVWTGLSVRAGLRVPVGVRPDGRLRGTALRRRQERLATVVVGHVRPAVPEPVVQQQAQFAGETDQPLASGAVLDRGPLIGPVDDRHALILRRVIVDVKRVRRAHSHHRVPQQRHCHVGERGVLVALEIIERRLGVPAVEHHLPDVVARPQVRRLDFDVELRIDRVDRSQPSDEHPERVHLRLQRGLREVAVVSAPESVLVNLPPRQLVQVGDLPIVAPSNEVAETRPVRPKRRDCHFRFFLVKVQFERGLWIDWFECHGSLDCEPHDAYNSES